MKKISTVLLLVACFQSLAFGADRGEDAADETRLQHYAMLDDVRAVSKRLRDNKAVSP